MRLDGELGVTLLLEGDDSVVVVDSRGGLDQDGLNMDLVDDLRGLGLLVDDDSVGGERMLVDGDQVGGA